MLFYKTNDMKTLTVFTPTFNRAHLLPKLYKSLCAQTYKDFLWLVIDDGSSDGTDELVKEWQAENKIEIRYQYKENGGMHTGHNLALELIQTELNVCIDSDDYMTDNAVEIITSFWRENKNEKYAGILGLNRFEDGKLVSSKEFPENIKSGKYSLLKSKYGIAGDVKFIYATEVIKRYPSYPVFSDENFVPLGYKYAIIDKDFDMLFMNETVCIVEYMDDGSTRNIFRQYYNNPKGFVHSRKQNLNSLFNYKEKYVIAVHLVAEAILARKSIFKDNSQKTLTFFAIPLGVLLYGYILYLNKK